LEYINDKTKEAEVNYLLSQVNKSLNEFDEAINNLSQALNNEPNNPRYLDSLLELGIMKKDKNLAEETLKKMAEVNPENQKLGEWENKIKEL